MRYFVTLDPASSASASPIFVDVVELPSGKLDVKVNGRSADVDVLALRDAAQLSVRVDGRMVDLTIEGSPPEVGAVASGHRSYVRVESERMRAAEQAKKSRGGDTVKLIRSPMPGRVVKILVNKGDEVQAGQPLLVVEAMKMENEVRAKGACTVAEIHVKAGDAVEGNAKLVTLA